MPGSLAGLEGRIMNKTLEALALTARLAASFSIDRCHQKFTVSRINGFQPYPIILYIHRQPFPLFSNVPLSKLFYPPPPSLIWGHSSIFDITEKGEVITLNSLNCYLPPQFKLQSQLGFFLPVRVGEVSFLVSDKSDATSWLPQISTFCFHPLVLCAQPLTLYIFLAV